MASSDNSTPHFSGEYDRKVRATIPNYEMILSETLDLAETIKPDAGIWLDTGCGTGELVRLALERFPRTRFVLADPSGGMLDEAKKKLEGYSGERVTFVEGTGSADLPGEYRNTDIITAVQCHHYMDKEGRRAATRRCYELLAEGGVYICFENIRPLSTESTEWGLKRWGRFQTGKGKTADQVEKHLQRFDTEYFPITVPEYLGLLRECGFRVMDLFFYAAMQAGFYGIK